jgi:hypothetical protein
VLGDRSSQVQVLFSLFLRNGFLFETEKPFFYVGTKAKLSYIPIVMNNPVTRDENAQWIFSNRISDRPNSAKRCGLIHCSRKI